MEEERYETVNVAAKITSFAVPSEQPKPNSKLEPVRLLYEENISLNKPEKPVKPKKLLNLADDNAHITTVSTPPPDGIPVAAVEIEINTTVSSAEIQVSSSITDRSSPYSIWSGMKLLPSYINSKVHAVSAASGFSSSAIKYGDIIKSGHLFKMNREGSFKKNIFLLMPDKLVYFKQSVVLTLGDDIKALRRVELPSDYHYNQLFLNSSTIMYVYYFLNKLFYLFKIAHVHST